MLLTAVFRYGIVFCTPLHRACYQLLSVSRLSGAAYHCAIAWTQVVYNLLSIAYG